MSPPSRSSSRLRRRELLLAAGAVVSACAGCIGRVDDGESTPPPDPEPVESAYDLAVEHDIESWNRYDPDWTAPETSPLDATFDVEPLIEGLEIPWDLEFASDGTCFISERVGRISRYEAGDLDAVTEPDAVIDHATSIETGEEGGWWAAGGEGGLLGIALHPNYPDVPVLYAFYTYEAEDLRNRLSYFDLSDDDAEETVVIDALPANDYHNGSRLAFGPRNYLWVTTGDAGEGELAADPNSLAGKVLRLEPDGTAPDDNPDVGDPRVYSYGHRNPQTMTFLPDGTPIVTEHGPSARDEVIALEAGGDHGWPTVRSGGEDDEYGRYGNHDGVTPPIVNTGSSEVWAPSGGVFYTGDAVEPLRNRLLVGGLGSQTLRAVTIYRGQAADIGGTRYDDEWLHPDYEAVVHELFEDELGRIRHVEQGPDGALYAITSNRDGRATGRFPTSEDDRLVRIVQA
jgi:glucose/arabinose dehydrogenase